MCMAPPLIQLSSICAVASFHTRMIIVSEHWACCLAAGVSVITTCMYFLQTWARKRPSMPTTLSARCRLWACWSIGRENIWCSRDRLVMTLIPLLVAYCSEWWWWLSPHFQGFWENVRLFIPCLHCFFVLFLEVEISLLAPVPLFRPGSVHSGSVSGDDWPDVPWQVACELVSG